MKLTTVLLPLGLFVSSSLAVGITITMAGGGTKDLDIPTTGECIDLFQGTHHARLNGGTDGTRWIPDARAVLLVRFQRASGKVTWLNLLMVLDAISLSLAGQLESGRVQQ
ncbi:hypothetical protein MW887_010733 [Aspergillus wentii]|nr:hypothetical protein MW887_010733 [Aspergillus wentii]